MAFLDNLGKKASEATAKAVQKAQGLSEVSRVNLLISEEEKKLNATYYQIGKLYVSVHGSASEDDFSGMVAAILESEQKINDYRKQIQSIKGIQRCEKCGAEVARGVAFCSSCGAPMPKVEAPSSDDVIRCESCGTLVKHGMRFCTSCGKPIVQMTATEPTNMPITEGEAQNKICPSCGATVEADVAFCTECGTKL
jgi:rRNA maturation endonuclease Nob1